MYEENEPFGGVGTSKKPNPTQQTKKKTHKKTPYTFNRIPLHFPSLDIRDWSKGRKAALSICAIENNELFKIFIARKSLIMLCVLHVSIH